MQIEKHGEQYNSDTGTSTESPKWLSSRLSANGTVLSGYGSRKQGDCIAEIILPSTLALISGVWIKVVHKCGYVWYINRVSKEVQTMTPCDYGSPSAFDAQKYSNTLTGDEWIPRSSDLSCIGCSSNPESWVTKVSCLNNREYHVNVVSRSSHYAVSNEKDNYLDAVNSIVPRPEITPGEIQLSEWDEFYSSLMGIVCCFSHVNSDKVSEEKRIQECCALMELILEFPENLVISKPEKLAPSSCQTFRTAYNDFCKYFMNYIVAIKTAFDYWPQPDITATIRQYVNCIIKLLHNLVSIGVKSCISPSKELSGRIYALENEVLSVISSSTGFSRSRIPSRTESFVLISNCLDDSGVLHLSNSDYEPPEKRIFDTATLTRNRKNSQDNLDKNCASYSQEESKHQDNKYQDNKCQDNKYQDNKCQDNKYQDNKCEIKEESNKKYFFSQQVSSAFNNYAKLTSSLLSQLNVLSKDFGRLIAKNPCNCVRNIERKTYESFLDILAALKSLKVISERDNLFYNASWENRLELAINQGYLRRLLVESLDWLKDSNHVGEHKCVEFISINLISMKRILLNLDITLNKIKKDHDEVKYEIIGIWEDKMGGRLAYACEMLDLELNKSRFVFDAADMRYSLLPSMQTASLSEPLSSHDDKIKEDSSSNSLNEEPDDDYDLVSIGRSLVRETIMTLSNRKGSTDYGTLIKDIGMLNHPKSTEGGISPKSRKDSICTNGSNISSMCTNYEDVAMNAFSVNSSTREAVPKISTSESEKLRKVLGNDAPRKQNHGVKDHAFSPTGIRLSFLYPGRISTLSENVLKDDVKHSSMCCMCAHSPSEIKFSSQGKVELITLNALLEHLILPIASHRSIEMERTVVLTYLAFTDTVSLIRELIQTYNKVKERIGKIIVEDEEEQSKLHANVVIQISAKLFLLLCCIITEGNTYLSNEATRANISEIIKTLYEDEKKDCMGFRHMCLIDAFWGKTSKLLSETQNKSKFEDEYLEIISINSDTTLIGAPEPVYNSKSWVCFENLDLLELSRQLCILEMRNYLKLSHLDLMENFSMSSKKITNKTVLEILASHKKIAFWTSQTVLKEKSLTKRVKILEKFIQLGKYCYSFNNYNTLTAILLGLASSYIQRLSKTWKLLPKESMNLLMKLRDTTTPYKNFSAYKNVLKTKGGPKIPYASLYTTELKFIHINYNIYVKTETEVFDYLHMRKLHLYAESLEEILKHQSTPYIFIPVPEIQLWLNSSITTCTINEKSLYFMSVACEP